VNALIHIFAFGVGCVMAYQSYDALRSAHTGTQPNASAPEENPQAIKTRAGGLLWGIMSMGISLVAFCVAFFG